jgi:peptidoglycan/LPS O-acetylase OafA/YrhL
LLGFSVGLGLLMPLLSQLRWPGTAPVLAVIGVAYLSELTYPLYLLHAFRIHVGTAQGATALATGLLSIVSLFVAASVLHLGVERPFLAWRDRIDGSGRRYAEPVLAPLPPSAAAPRLAEIEGSPAPEVA